MNHPRVKTNRVKDFFENIVVACLGWLFYFIGWIIIKFIMLAEAVNHKDWIAKTMAVLVVAVALLIVSVLFLAETLWKRYDRLPSIIKITVAFVAGVVSSATGHFILFALFVLLLSFLLYQFYNNIGKEHLEALIFVFACLFSALVEPLRDLQGEIDWGRIKYWSLVLSALLASASAAIDESIMLLVLPIFLFHLFARRQARLQRLRI